MKRIYERWFCSDRWLLVIVLVAASLGFIYNAAILVGMGPDEPRHMAYVQLLWDEHCLPILLPDGSEYHGAHSFHPPLYYLLLLPLYAVARLFSSDVTWHLVRLGSLALCLAALPLIYQIALAAGGRGVARLATMFIAWLPMWNMTAATVNNDSAAFFAVTLFLWLLAVRFADERSLRSAVVLGIVLGLGTLCKATTLLCDGVAFLIYLWHQQGRSVWKTRNAWSRALAVAGATFLIAGWWHARSLALYGQFTPLPPMMPAPVLPNPQLGKLIILMHPNFPTVFAWANQEMFKTLWSQKDWLLWTQEPNALRDGIRNAIYIGFAVFVLGAFLRLALRRNNDESNAAENLSAKIARHSSLGAFAANWLAVLQVALFWHWGWSEGGRYLLPSLCGLTICAARGWNSLSERRLRFITILFGAFLLFVNGIALYWLLAYLNPTFGTKS